MRKFFFKIFILIAIVIFGQVFLARFIVPSISILTLGMPGIGKLDTYLNLNEKYPILYFGDSIIKAYDPNDKDTSSIAEMLSAIEPKLKIGDMSSPAYHLGMFEAMFKHIEMSPQKPSAVIIPINLRSFSQQWDMRPEYQFENEIFYLTHSKFIFYFGKPIGIFHAINIHSVTEEMFRKLPVYYGDIEVGTVGTYEDKAKLPIHDDAVMRDFYIYDYMGRLDPNHRKLNSLKNLIDISKRIDVKIYVYLAPIDYEDGTQYVGSDFKKQILENSKLVCSVLLERGIPCLNLALALKTKDFAHPGLPNEHLNEAGRKAVALKLRDFIMKNSLLP